MRAPRKPTAAQRSKHRGIEKWVFRRRARPAKRGYTPHQAFESFVTDDWTGVKPEMANA